MVEGTCSNNARVFVESQYFPLSIPNLSGVSVGKSLSNSGYGFVTGGRVLGNTKFGCRPTSFLQPFNHIFKEWSDVENEGVSSEYVNCYILSDANSRCFLACHQYVFNCNIYCADGLPSAHAGFYHSRLWVKPVPIQTLARLFDFSGFDLDSAVSVNPILEHIRECDDASASTFTPFKCISVLNRIVEALSGQPISPYHPTSATKLNWIFQSSTNRKSVRNDLILILERYLRTRSFVFQAPVTIDLAPLGPSQEHAAGWESVNFEALLQSYRRRILAGLQFTLNELERVRQTNVLAKIQDVFSELTAVPKLGGALRRSRALIAEVAGDFNRIKDPVLSLSLQGCSSACGSILNVCLYGGRTVLYDPTVSALSFSSRSVGKGGVARRGAHKDNTGFQSVYDSVNATKTWGLLSHEEKMYASGFGKEESPCARNLNCRVFLLIRVLSVGGGSGGICGGEP